MLFFMYDRVIKNNRLYSQILALLDKSGNDQDSDVERPWAHLLPLATLYTKIITVYTTPIDEKGQNTSRKISYS